MMRTPLALALVACLLPTTVPTVAHAAPDAADSAENRALAESLFFKGRKLMEEGKFAEACTKLAESYRLDPASGTLLNLAECHKHEGKIATAWGEFRQVQFDARKGNRPDREEYAEKQSESLLPELPQLTIEVRREVVIPGLEIARNGVPLRRGAWSTELPIDPGQGEIEARAPGYKPWKTAFTIDNRERKVIAIPRLELAPVQASASSDNGGWTSQQWWGATLAGAGLVGIGVGTAFGVASLQSKSQSDASCPVVDGERRCDQAGVDAMNRATTQGWVSTFAVGAGIAAAAGGVYLFLSSPKKGEDGASPSSQASTAWRWNLTGGPQGPFTSVVRAF